MGQLTKYLTFILILYVYVNTYRYNAINKAHYHFVQDFFLNEHYLEQIFKSNIQKKERQHYYKELLLFTTNFVPLSCVMVKFFGSYHVSMFLATFRRVIALALNLQWSLCIYHLNVQTAKLRHLINDVFSQKNSDTSSSMYIKNDEDVTDSKILSLSRIDALIEAYRYLSAKHRNVIDYYGVYIACNLSVMLLSILLTACLLYTSRCV